MWAWLIIACGGPSVERLSLPGIEVALPEGFAPAPEIEQAQLAGMRQSRPHQAHELVAARRSRDRAVVQLQRSEDAAPDKYGATVREVLDAVTEDLGLRASAAQAADRPVRTVCGRAEGASVTSCATVGVVETGPLVVWVATCSGAPDDVCAGLVADAVVTPGSVMPLDAVLAGPVPAPGSDVWGLRLGASRAAFQAACRAAGFAVDAYDWAQEPPVVREWVEAGRASRCEGLPERPALGPVTKATAVFETDRLIGLSVYLQADPNAVEEVLAEQYPLAVAGQDQVMHVIDGEAVDDALMSVTLFRAGDASSTLSFLSARGYAATAL